MLTGLEYTLSAAELGADRCFMAGAFTEFSSSRGGEGGGGERSVGKMR